MKKTDYIYYIVLSVMVFASGAGFSVMLEQGHIGAAIIWAAGAALWILNIILRANINRTQGYIEGKAASWPERFG